MISFRISGKAFCWLLKSPILLSGAMISIALFASAQVAVIPNVPAYPFQVLPGSTRQINVNITGGTLNKVNWSVLSTTGGALATFTTPVGSDVAAVSAGLPTVQVNIGPTAGNCTITGSVGSYAIATPASITIQAQSVDDPTKTGTFLFNVCAKTTTVIVAPAYQQAFKGQHRTLQSWISGDTDETGTWSIESQPSGGDGTLADTTNRDTDFIATVSGRYTIEYVSHSNPGKSATAIVYVSPNPLPTYPSTPNKTEPHECYVDSAFTGGDYEVGAGKKYATIQSTPAISSLAPGSIIRIWNTDATGSNPSTFHEYYQIASTGTASQPIIMCGVPDSLGNLPILDGSNAIGQSDITTDGAAAGAGIIATWPNNGHYGPWQGGSVGPSYVSITGLHLRNANATFSYYPPGSGTTLTPYGEFVSCVNLASGTYIDVSGNDMDTCGLGIFTAENSNNAWATITQAVTIMGNHIHKAGEAGQDGEHGAYFQSWYGLFQGNLVDEYQPTAVGSEVKWRGVEGIFRYNCLATGAARDFDLVDNQDAYPYVTFEGYLGTPGDTVDGSFYSGVGDKAGANIIAAYQESLQKDFLYGNEIFGASAGGQIHYLGDQVDGMENRGGVLYFYSNTLDDAQWIFDTGSNGDGLNSYYVGRIDARNNILWAYNVPYPGASITMGFGGYSTIIMDATTNLMRSGTFTIQIPIEGADPSNGTSEGWSNRCDGACKWPLSVPLDPHLYGLSNANYLTTGTQPYSSTTMVPPAGSAAIEAGTPLDGVLATMPVRWQYSIATNSLIPRVDPLTVGAVDYAAVAATPTFSPSAGQYNSAQTVTINSTTPLAKIYYTTNGTTPTTNSTLYSGPISVSASETVKAIVIATGYLQSAVGSAVYGIGPPAATPTFVPAGGTYASVQTVAISTTTTAGSPVIYYTTDGSNPASSSTAVRYTGPITVSTTETVNAITEATGYSNSEMASATYSINLPVTDTPTFLPAAGTFSSVQTVTISDVTPGASIYYTTDGSTPAYPISGTTKQYTGAISVAATETVNAIATATGYEKSNVGSAAYTINLPFIGPNYVQQCDNFTQHGKTVSCTLTGVGAGHTLVIGIANMTAGMAGTATASSGIPSLAVTDSNAISAWVLSNTSAGNNTITYTVAANTRLWLSVVEYSNTAASPLDGASYADFSSSWQNSGVLNTPGFNTASASDLLWSFCAGTGGTPTIGTAPVTWTGLPGPASSTVLVEDGDAKSAGSYFGQCTSNEGEIITLALMPPQALTPADAPTFSLAAGTYTTPQTVAISDTTLGVTIYYTTNGTPPTTGSTVYSAPITVSSTETLEAIAVASGFSTSSVVSAHYSINLPAASFTVSGTAVTVSAPGATTGNTSAITVTPTGGFTGSVLLTAAITGSPSGSQYPPALSFGTTSPVSITGSNSGTATLTISTTAATRNALMDPGRQAAPWYAAGGATLAGILLVCIPVRRRGWRATAGLLIFLALFSGGVLSCGGGATAPIGGGSVGNPGTTAGIYRITVTGTSGSNTASGTVTLTVQ